MVDPVSWSQIIIMICIPTNHDRDRTGKTMNGTYPCKPIRSIGVYLNDRW